ncbi:MAG: tRNA dihydrouridine synthase DusB [Actinomycetes bacterium]|jgi:nifR3 family TIM-barrel protein|nr:tRNA dihydrouridine synthase DusB [Actinomycetes bacterium]
MTDKELHSPVPYQLFQAPMAGVGDAPFRGLCKRYGADLTCTEMVSAKGLHYDRRHKRSHRYLRLHPDETPAAVQLFGREESFLAAQARAVVDKLGPAIAAIDLNAGCPVPKVVRKGEGSALMAEPELPARLVAAMVAALDGTGVPVTVKIRAGVTADAVNAVEVARRCQDAGVARIAIHGRTADQYYSGCSDTDVIAAVKAAVSVPVIASGDLMTCTDVARVLEATHADGVMIARGALGNPWIFPQTRGLLQHLQLGGTAGEYVPTQPSVPERLAVMREHAADVVDWYGVDDLARFRGHAAGYIKGLPGAAVFRRRIQEIKTLAALDTLIEEYLAYER